MRYKLVLFDLDGVIYDQQPSSESNITIKQFAFEQHYNEGMPLDNIIEQLCPLWNPYPGMMELLEAIPAKGLVTNGPTPIQRAKIAHMSLDKLITPELIFVSYQEAERILENENHPYLSGLDSKLSRFEKVMRIAKEYTSKPQPYMVTRALIEYGCSPEECIMIGDQNVDITAAKSAGTLAIKVEGVKPLSFQNASPQIYQPDFTVHKSEIAPALYRLLF